MCTRMSDGVIPLSKGGDEGIRDVITPSDSPLKMGRGDSDVRWVWVNCLEIHFIVIIQSFFPILSEL